MVDNSSYPFSAIRLVAETINGVAGHGSGVLIAPDEFLTAAHVVFRQGTGVASSVFVVPGLNGSDEPFGEITVDRFHYITVNNFGGVQTRSSSEQDFALLHLSRSVSGAGTMALKSNFTAGSVHLTGYADTSVNAEADEVVTGFADSSTATMSLSIVPATGTSGGPLWSMTGSAATAYGIVSAGNWGAELSTPMVNLINSWIAEDRTSTGSGGIAVSPIDIHHVSSNVNAATVFGGLGGDTVTGSGASQWLVAGIGNERLVATGTNSIIFGGSGADTLVGSGSGTFMLAGSGPTRMISGPGVQGMAGGAGSDAFEINAGQGNSFAAIYSKGFPDRLEIHAIPGSVIDTPAEALAFELSDGANSFVYLGDNAQGAFWIITVGTAHLGASDIVFV